MPAAGGGGAPSTPVPAAAPAPQATDAVVAQKTTAGVKGATKTVVAHAVSARGTVRATAGTAAAQFVISKTSVRYVDARAHLRFVSTRVTSVVVSGRTATLRGVGTSNGKRGVPFRVTLVATTPAKIGVAFGRYVRAARVVSGTVSVR
jgi:hypothetical protein